LLFCLFRYLHHLRPVYGNPIIPHNWVTGWYPAKRATHSAVRKLSVIFALRMQKMSKLDAARPRRKENRKLALVSLIQAAMFLSAEALPHLKTVA
jgi:hypothetical protein